MMIDFVSEDTPLSQIPEGPAHPHLTSSMLATSPQVPHKRLYPTRAGTRAHKHKKGGNATPSGLQDTGTSLQHQATPKAKHPHPRSQHSPKVKIPGEAVHKAPRPSHSGRTHAGRAGHQTRNNHLNPDGTIATSSRGHKGGVHIPADPNKKWLTQEGRTSPWAGLMEWGQPTKQRHAPTAQEALAAGIALERSEIASLTIQARTSAKAKFLLDSFLADIAAFDKGNTDTKVTKRSPLHHQNSSVLHVHEASSTVFHPSPPPALQPNQHRALGKGSRHAGVNHHHTPPRHHPAHH